eukprot:593683-Prymnesium_polylepis.1
MVGVYAARQAGSAGGRRARTFRSFHHQRISSALAKGLAFELRHGNAGPPRAWRRRRLRVSARTPRAPEQGEAGALTLPWVLGPDA